MTATHRVLKVLAAITWYAGSIVLASKGTSLVMEAHAQRPGQRWPWLVLAVGLLAGAVKAGCFFARICRRNLARIDRLTEPELWQFFRPGFFVFLALMVALGASLSKMAHDNYTFLLCVAALDFSLATALLGSSYVFWKEKAFYGDGESHLRRIQDREGRG